MAIPKNAPGGEQRRPSGLPPRPGSGLPSGRPGGIPPRVDPNRAKVESSGTPDFELPAIDLSGAPSHMSEKNFGESRISRVTSDPRQNQQVRNEYDSDDDDTFTTIPVAEQLGYDEAEREREIADETARRDAEMRAAAKAKRDAEIKANMERIRLEKEAEATAKLLESENISSDDEDLEISANEPSNKKGKAGRGFKKSAKSKKADTEQDVFIDKENLKLKTFGDKGDGKRSVRVNDFDSRKNLRKQAQIVKYVALGLAVVALVITGKNAFFPQKALDAGQIDGLISKKVGITDFPLEAGKGFAKDFMQAYLSVNKDKASDRVLGYYYTGAMSPTDVQTRTYTNGVKQTILYGPTVYEEKGLTNHSARYTIGAVVQPESEKSAAPVDGSSAEWIYFNVNVYYDKVTNKFSITPDSPSLLPSVSVGQPSKVPAASPIGTGKADKDLTVEVTSIVQGFIKEYAISSPSSSSNLEPYVTTESKEELKTGLAKEYVFAGSESDSIMHTAYPTAKLGEVKVEVSVNWKKPIGSDKSGITYKSNYIMTLNKQANGKYLVSKFAPKYYSADLKR